VKRVVNGPQTPKSVQPDLELNIPIIFDFSRKLHSPIFSAKIPFGQRFLKITLARLSDLIYGIDLGGGGAVTTPLIFGELWSNQIFLLPEITNRLLPGISRTFLRVYKESRFRVTPGTNLQKLDDLRLPTEAIYFGLRPDGNNTATNWWKFHSENTTPVTVPIRLPPNQLAFRTVNLNTPVQSMSGIRFLSRSTEVTRPTHDTFFNVLQPLLKSRSPNDPGLQLMCFARDTLTEHPTAYFNISIDREFFMEFTANFTGEVYVLAYCLNWLEIDEAGVVKIKNKV